MTSERHQQRRSISTTSVLSSADTRSRSPSPSASTQTKIVGACSSCRRSKVKCEHDGTSPCKRCRNGGYECTFKPRELGSAFLQDEWRIKTDETLSRLVSAVNALVQQESSYAAGRKRKAEVEPWDHHDVSKKTAGPIHLSTRYEWSVPLASSSTPRPSSRDGSLAPGFDHTIEHDDLYRFSSADEILQTNANHLIRSALRARASLPLPPILECTTSHPSPRQPLIARSSQYRHPSPSLGSSDPRLDAIRLGHLSSHTARSLFALYSKSIEPLSFGFPDFPANSNLTPVLLSSITSVSSFLSPHPDLRKLHLRLRSDLLSRTLPYTPSSSSDEFNPESGIGTEEVIGSCIFASTEASADSYQLARAARWWSEKYSYETGPHAGLTVGEMVAILPPVREVSMQDRVRVWLSAYTVELHQCEMRGGETIMEVVDPGQYGEVLIGGEGVSKQDAGLVFYSRIAYCVAKARSGRQDAEELCGVAREITASWIETRALLATESDMKVVWDHTIDLHYMLAKAVVLMRACRAHETSRSNEGADFGTAEWITCMQTCQSTCLDSIRLLMSPRAGFLGNLAALPAIYHYWIAGCLMFLIQLCRPDGLHYQLGLLAEGQLGDILRTVEAFMQVYFAELSACNTSIVNEGDDGNEPCCEVMKHPATDAAVAVSDVLASVQATA